MRKKLRGILGELLMGFVVALVCAALLFAVVAHYRELMMKSKYLPYSIQGYSQGDVLLVGNSFMEYWSASEADLGPLHTVNAGGAGIQVHHWKENINKHTCAKKIFSRLFTEGIVYHETDSYQSSLNVMERL